MFGLPIRWWLCAVDIRELCFILEHRQREVVAPLRLRHGQNGLDLVHFRGRKLR